MPWHVTPSRNAAAILREGLRPMTGPRSELIGEEKARVYLFSSYDDLESGEWLLDQFDEDEQLCLFHVALPAQEGAWTELEEPVGTELLNLIAIDMDDLEGDALRALYALDRVTDPLSDLESFRKTRCRMRAAEFGRLVGDMSWDEDAGSEFLVYAAGYWVEALPDGQHMLTIGNQGMITGAGRSLEDLEAELFDYAWNETRAAPKPEAEPGPLM